MDRLRKYLRILLPALFIAYLGCIIAFTHVHIVNGVTIVHSHPFHKTDDGRPDHEHGYAEFQLLHQLSVLQITGAAFVATLHSRHNKRNRGKAQKKQNAETKTS